MHVDDARTVGLIAALPMFSCLTLLGLVGKTRAEMFDLNSARRAVLDKYQGAGLTDVAIIEESNR